MGADCVTLLPDQFLCIDEVEFMPGQKWLVQSFKYRDIDDDLSLFSFNGYRTERHKIKANIIKNVLFLALLNGVYQS